MAKKQKGEVFVDYRMPLKFHTVLEFEGMSCQIEQVIGQGSNAIVYRGWYQDNLNRELRHRVLVKELFPFHPMQKIWREEDGSVAVAPEAEELWKTHWESFEAGNQVHLRLLDDNPDLMVMGANINSFRHNGTLYSVLGYTGGRSLQAELDQTGASLRRTVLRMIGLLDALEAFHKSGYLHLDISPDNIMLVGQEEQERIFLIDYNSARKINDRSGGYFSRKPGFSAPEVSTGDLGDVGFPADLYSVAAVFFRCIMGRSLALAQMLQPRAPEVRDCPLLMGMPETVISMVSAILKKGLHTLARRRYQSIGQMRQVFRELMDRIDCVGVTHWSLWENGKRSVEDLINTNPSLRYLKEADRLYPIRLEQMRSMSLEEYLGDILSPEGKSGMILAQGGMGKTTLLLHSAMLRSRRYSPTAPAVFYISLNGWEQGSSNYIRSQILMRLRFKREENTFDSAMHALHKLLEQPIRTRQGDIPGVLLLLDGLNEVRGDTAPLVQEINKLNAMPGVRILASSRSVFPELELETAVLMPLNTEDIAEALGRNGLLIPWKQDVIHLLRTPLILSIYIQASEGGRQLDVHSEDELMRAYLDSLLEKEIRELPEDSPHHWQIDVALNYVLPAIAAEVKKGRSLTDRQLLQVVENCRRTLRSSLMKRVFPQWIGHSREIFGEAETADQWYGIMIHRLLWQRLGVLTRETNGDYRIFHQVVAEHLASAYRGTGRSLRLLRGLQAAAVAVLAAAVCCVFQYQLLPALQSGGGEALLVSYDVEDTRSVIDHVVSCYSAYGSRYTEMERLLRLVQEDQTRSFLSYHERYFQRDYPEVLLSEYRETYLTEITALCASGDQVEWSALEFDGESAARLITEAGAQLEEYKRLLLLLEDWVQSERVQQFCPAFPEKVGELLQLDGQIMSKLYHQSCQPHIGSGAEVWRRTIMSLVSSIPEAGAEPEETVDSLVQKRKQVIGDLSALAATIQLTTAAENS